MDFNKKIENKEKDSSVIINKLNKIKEILSITRNIFEEIEDAKSQSIKDNVIFISPHIVVEYEKFYNMRNEKSVVSLLQKYEKWSHEIYFITIANKSALKNNNKLRKHLIDSLIICESLDFSFRNIFNNNK